MADDDKDRILDRYGPQDEHGFLFSRVGGDLKFNPYEAVKNFMGYRAPPGALSTSGDDTPVRNAADVAGWVGLSGLGLNAFGAVPANALGSASAKAPQALRAAIPKRVENPIRAYHGSPHDFDRFDLSKIGTGEGAQAYGHGLYFAENPEVAKSYREALSPQIGDISRPERLAAEWYLWMNKDSKKAAQIARTQARETKKDKALAADWVHAAELLESNNYQPPGRMYEVAIHASPDQFLDWDKPLLQQKGAARAFAESNLAGYGDGKRDPLQMTGAEFYRGLDAPHDTLREAGIPGVRYLDQGSRGAGDGTSNYVVFDPARIEILRKYGLLGPLAGLSTADILQRYGQDDKE